MSSPQLTNRSPASSLHMGVDEEAKMGGGPGRDECVLSRRVGQNGQGRQLRVPNSSVQLRGRLEGGTGHGGRPESRAEGPGGRAGREQAGIGKGWRELCELERGLVSRLPSLVSPPRFLPFPPPHPLSRLLPAGKLRDVQRLKSSSAPAALPSPTDSIRPSSTLPHIHFPAPPPPPCANTAKGEQRRKPGNCGKGEKLAHGLFIRSE